MRVLLISPYELGRQPFGLAEPAGMLEKIGCVVDCLDLSLQRLDADLLAAANLVGIYVGMHTATRLAVEAMARIQGMAPQAHLCVYGLYAPMNEGLLRNLGAKTVLGGEFEPGLVALAERLRVGDDEEQVEPVVSLSKVDFIVPKRSGLPALSRYAHLEMPDGVRRTVGFVEASRGCKHLCRHCPVVPVYQGRFRIVPVDIVLADAEHQVRAGAHHLSFGDPDFLNGPTHAVRIVHGLHQRFPQLTYDVTVKVEHIIKYRHLLPLLQQTGCLFVTSAVESVDDEILSYLDKGHTDADFEEAVTLLRQSGIGLVPTFVAFTPWTTLEGYIDLLRRIVQLKLVESIPPIQLAIRLLVPKGSFLFKLPDFSSLVYDFDASMLGYPWKHDDPRVDHLQKTIEGWVAAAEAENVPRREIFEHIWEMAHQILGRPPPSLGGQYLGDPIPHLSEPWYCCAEPTSQQLRSF